MEKYISHIYDRIKAYDPRIGFIPYEDARQEIAIAILTAEDSEVYRVASRNINQLCRSFGYAGRRNDDIVAQIAMSRTERTNEENQLLDAIDGLYRGQNKTAREVAQEIGVEYTKKFQKLMCLCFPKHMGRGGARKNAGRKAIN